MDNITNEINKAFNNNSESERNNSTHNDLRELISVIKSSNKEQSLSNKEQVEALHVFVNTFTKLTSKDLKVRKQGISEIKSAKENLDDLKVKFGSQSELIEELVNEATKQTNTSRTIAGLIKEDLIGRNNLFKGFWNNFAESTNPLLGGLMKGIASVASYTKDLRERAKDNTGINDLIKEAEDMTKTLEKQERLAQKQEKDAERRKKRDEHLLKNSDKQISLLKEVDIDLDISNQKATDNLRLTSKTNELLQSTDKDVVNVDDTIKDLFGKVKKSGNKVNDSDKGVIKDKKQGQYVKSDDLFKPLRMRFDALIELTRVNIASIELVESKLDRLTGGTGEIVSKLDKFDGKPGGDSILLSRIDGNLSDLFEISYKTFENTEDIEEILQNSHETLLKISNFNEDQLKIQKEQLNEQKKLNLQKKEEESEKSSEPKSKGRFNKKILKQHQEDKSSFIDNISSRIEKANEAANKSKKTKTRSKPENLIKASEKGSFLKDILKSGKNVSKGIAGVIAGFGTSELIPDKYDPLSNAIDGLIDIYENGPIEYWKHYKDAKYSIDQSNSLIPDNPQESLEMYVDKNKLEMMIPNKPKFNELQQNYENKIEKDSETTTDKGGNQTVQQNFINNSRNTSAPITNIYNNPLNSRSNDTSFKRELGNPYKDVFIQ